MKVFRVHNVDVPSGATHYTGSITKNPTFYKEGTNSWWRRWSDKDRSWVLFGALPHPEQVELPEEHNFTISLDDNKDYPTLIQGTTGEVALELMDFMTTMGNGERHTVSIFRADPTPSDVSVLDSCRTQLIAELLKLTEEMNTTDTAVGRLLDELIAKDTSSGRG